MPFTNRPAFILLASILTLLGGCLASEDSDKAGSSSPTDTTSDSTNDQDTSSTPSIQTTEGDSNPLTEQEIKDFIQAANQYRSQEADCGEEGVFPAQAALSWDQKLADAAQVHSNDQYKISTMTHTGSDDSDPGERITAQGYIWSTYGENVAKGYSSVEAVAEGWMNSPGHCKNMMNGNFTELGIAATGENSQRYWTLNLAKPKG